jgi:hypothetical protein
MLKAILNFFTRNSSLEYFIESRNPQTIQEIEDLCKLWMKHSQNNLI